MRKELEELRAKVKNYDDLFNSKDPAYASLLMKRVFQLLQNDTHMLWKILQENLGREWFQRPVLNRNLNYKYHIDYEPLDSILGDLAKIVIGNHPADATKIASTQDCLVMSYMIEAFHAQKSNFVKELTKKDQLEQKLFDNIDEVSSKHMTYKGEDTIQSSRQGHVPSALSNQSPYPDSNTEQLQSLIRMLMTEITNMRSEKISIVSELEALKGEYKLLERFVTEVADAAGVVKEGVAIVKLLGKMKKIDQGLLVKNNFAKVIALGKTDLIAKTALMVS